MMADRYAAMLGVALLAVVAGSGAEPAASSLYTTVGEGIPNFRLMERSGRTITLDDLPGKISVVSFFFTSCTAGCAQTQAGMKRLQDDLAAIPDVLLVSITVDPQTDTPEHLREYAT